MVEVLMFSPQPARGLLPLAPLAMQKAASGRSSCVSRREFRKIRPGYSKKSIWRTTGTKGVRVKERGIREIRNSPVCGSQQRVMHVAYKRKRPRSLNAVELKIARWPDLDGNGTTDVKVDMNRDRHLES